MLVRLLNQTLEQHPDIRPEAIVGHADIAPTRKADPGPLFLGNNSSMQGLARGLMKSRDRACWLNGHYPQPPSNNKPYCWHTATSLGYGH